MAQPSIPQFLESLGASQLLSDAQFKLLKKQLKGNPLTTDGLAQVLVRQKHLTDWQAKQLLKGQSGFVLNHYRLLNPIGRGGMGHVFRGMDSRTNEIVAVKVMAKKLTSNRTLVSRFRREIRASSQLNSPNIVRALDAGRVGKVDFMVMEFVNGDQVDRIANRLGRVPVGLACAMVQQIAKGLQHAHERKMVHRDIKPSNMMVHWDDSGAGTAKLMDMGLVLVLSDTDDEHTVTRAGQVMGTPDYMSPEQGWDTTQVDIRSDIYSLGCTLFRLLTGTIPFTGSNPLQVLSQRLQRDAPTVRSVCDDIPEDVSAVVEKMTKRHPDERYQEPADVVAVLEAFSEPLLKAGFQAAAQLATNDPHAEISEPQSDEVDEADVTYRQFLKEVGEGSVVDLMLSTDENVAPDAATVPAIDLNLNISKERTSTAKSRTRKPRGQNFGFRVLGGAVVVLMIAIAAVMFSGGGEDPVDTPEPGVEAPPSPVPTGSFDDIEPPVAETGSTWSFTPKVQTSNINGKVRFDLGEAAPVDMSLDSETGKLTWQVPLSQSTGPYTVPVTLHHVADDQELLLSETLLTVNVDYGISSVKFRELRPAELDVDKKHQAAIGLSKELSSRFDLRYRVEGDAPAGLTLDEKTGDISWTPRAEHIGRHAILVTVSREGEAKNLDQQELSLLVLPTTIAHVLPTIAKQKAKPGETVRVEFPATGLPNIRRIEESRVIEPGPGGPPGVDILPGSSGLEWKVPQDAGGTIRIPLIARLEMGRLQRERALSGTAIVEIEIAGEAPTMTADSLPSAELIDPVLKELRETYKQRLSAARSLPQKNILANQLLETSYNSEAGVADAALLQLIEEDLVSRSRAIDVAFDIATIRAARYKTDELTAAKRIVGTFRRSSLDATQHDGVIEHCLRLTRAAVSVDDFDLADQLLEVITSLLRGSAPQGPGAQLAADVATAAKLTSELVKDSGETSAIKTSELLRLLDRWQFRKLFTNTAELSYFGIREAGAGAVNGRGYWSFNDGIIELSGATLQAAVGFVDPSEDRGRFVVRLDVLPGTTSAQLVFGASGSGQNDFAAFGTIIDGTAPGRLVDIRNRTTIAEPPTNVRLLPEQANHVELIVDGSAVVVRINGTTVIQTQIGSLAEGRIGLAANLGVPEPKVAIRNARILELPSIP